MSEVKRYSPSESSYGIMRECDEGEWVDGSDYDALAAEAQALREDRDRIERNRDMWKGQCERQAEQLAALCAISEQSQ